MRRPALVLLGFLVLCAATATKAQTPNNIVTVVGGGTNTGVATSATTPGPLGLVRDGLGNTYFSSGNLDTVYKVTSGGQISAYAGIGVAGFSGDGGPATSAALNSPQGLAIDGNNNLFVADSGNNRIRRVDFATGTISTVAGSGNQYNGVGFFGGFSGDNGPATSALMNFPVGVAVDANENLFILDSNNNRVRKVDNSAQHIITTYAGNGAPATAGTTNGDGGPAVDAQLNTAGGTGAVAVGSNGNVYIADTGDSVVRIVDTSASHIISTYAGSPSQIFTFSGDNGPANAAGLNAPLGVSVDPNGNVFIDDSNNQRVRKVDTTTNHIITTVAGNGSFCTTFSTCGDGGPATSAVLNVPVASFADGSGNFWFAEFGTNRIRMVSAGTTPTISTFAGGGNGGDGGPASSAIISPVTQVLNSAGDMFIIDTGGYRVRRVDHQTHVISNYAGNGIQGIQALGNGDNGPATQGSLSRPQALALDGAGDLYIADVNAHVVRRVDAVTGTITTVAGNGTVCHVTATPGCGDGGQAINATFRFPFGVAVDSKGNLYIADAGLNRIRVVDVTTGVINNYAGTGAAGYSGDGNPATAATLNSPEGMAFDANGNLFFADGNNNRIRKIDTSVPPVISTYAFNGIATFGGDGNNALSASMQFPAQVALDPNANLFVGGGFDNVVRRIDAAAQTVITVAGNVTNLDGGFAGDNGPSTSALLQNFGVAIDANQNLFINDLGNNRVREVPLAPVTVVSPTSLMNFGSILAGAISNPQLVTVVNNGLADLMVTNITAPAGFTVTPACIVVQTTSQIIDPGGSCFLSVEFTPPASGAGGTVFGGNVAFSTNDPANPSFSFAVSGTAAGLPGVLLTVAPAGPAGAGTITASPIGVLNGSAAPIQCPQVACMADYAVGQTVTVFAIGNAGFTLTGWTVNGSATTCPVTDTFSCVVTMNAAQNVTATFGPASVSVGAMGNGSGTISIAPGGPTCTVTNGVITPNPCTATNFPAGTTTVTLTATATGTSTFAGWLGLCGLTGINTAGTGPCSISLSLAGVTVLNGSLATAVFSAAPQKFGQGDVFVGAVDGMIFEYTPTGTLVQVLNSGGFGGIIAGMNFDKNGNLYAANPVRTAVTNGTVEFFGNNGTGPTAFGTGYNSSPLGVLVGPSGNVFVGESSGENRLLEFANAVNGAPTTSFFPAYDSGGIGYIELLDDGARVLYTSGITASSPTGTVKNFDIANNRQNPDFSTGLTGGPAFALRELGDKSVLVANATQIVHLDQNGNPLSSPSPYKPGGGGLFFALNLNPDGASFWTGDALTGKVYQVQISTGAVLNTINTGLGFNSSALSFSTIFGIAVFGQPQSGGADLAAAMTAPASVAVNSNVTYSISVTNNGPANATNVTVTDVLPAGVTFVSATPSTGSCTGTTTVTCSLGTLNSGASPVTISIVVTATTAQTLTNTVNATSTIPDPVTTNNSATTSTTVGGSPATHFSVTGPTVATTGIAFNIIVTALDATNATASGYAGTVHFTSSDGNPVLPANSTLTNGVGTFLATLNTVGNQTITATDTVTASITGASGTITVTTTPGFGFSSTALPAGAVTVPYGADIQVTGGQQPYTFALANGSSLPAGFTLVPTASGNVAAGHVFNNSRAATGNFTFGITVTDSTPAAPQTATATISLTINAAPPNTQASLLQGRYGILSRKVGDSSTSLSDVAGSINFDGIGSFTLSFDQNSEGGNSGTQCNASGTYSVGPDFRGVLAITTVGACATGSLGGGGNLPVITFALGDVYRGVANTGRFVQFNDNDGNSGLAAGIFRRQDQNAFTSASLAGTYVLGLTGQDTNLGREVTLALATLNNSNMITAGTFDSNDNGTVTSGTFTGTYTTPDANGRSVLTLNTTPPGTVNIAMYIVSANQAFFLSLDPTTTNSLLAGEGDRQLNPNSFGLTSLQGPDIVTFRGTSSGGTNAGVGVLTASVVNTVGNFSLTADIDDGGNLKLGQTGNGTYTAASNGRALVTGTSTGGTINLIAYLIGPDRAFFIGKDSSDPPFGEIEPQVSAPFSASPFANNLFIGQAEMVPNQNSEFSGIAVLGTTGTLNITDDESHNGGDLFFDRSLGTLTFTVFSASGHFTGQTSDGSQISGYVVSPFEAAIIDTTGPATDPAPSMHPHLIIAQSIPAPPGTPSPATTSINFPTPVAIGSNAQSAPITITNTGLGPLGFTGQNVSNSPDFGASGACLATALVVIQPQGTCTLIVTFAPTASTATGVVLMETLTVTTDGGNITIAASGTAAAGVSGPTLKSIALTPANPTQPINSSLQFTATGTFSDGSMKDITTTVAWSSSNTGAATISASGLATTGATTALTTTISATLDNVTGSTVLTVSNSPISISVTPPPGGAFPPVPPGGRLAIGIVLTSTPGFSGTVTFSCTTSSPTITCAPDPASVTLTPGGPTDVAIVLNTFCTGTTTAASVPNPGGFGGGLPLLLLSLALGGFVWTYRQSPRWALSFAVLVLMAIGGAACSSLPKGPNGATPPGNYSVTFSATVNGVTTTTPPIPFTVQ